MLWGQPSSPYEGYAAINPLGNFIGAVIMVALGFIPTFIVVKILDGADLCGCRGKLNLWASISRIEKLTKLPWPMSPLLNVQWSSKENGTCQRME